MERRFFLITMAMTLCLALGFVVGRKAAPDRYYPIPCQEDAQGITPFPPVQLLAKKEREEFWNKLVGKL